MVLCFCLGSVVLALAPAKLIRWGLEARQQLKQQRQRVRGRQQLAKKIEAEDGTTYHVIFSTDCSGYHNWQSYVLFYHANRIQQPGTITRIASGCSEEDRIKLQDFHTQHIQESISSRFKIHFTPDYSHVKENEYFPYFNKPFSAKHWMERILGYPHPDGDPIDDAIIILLDPDMVPLRPITRHFDTNATTDRWKLDDRPSMVQHGSPVAQRYLLAPQWRRWNLTAIFGTTESRAHGMKHDEAKAYYEVGPPYVATARDFWKLVKRWTELCIPVKREYNNMLAEMYAYVLAAVDLNLPHSISYSLMISDPKVEYTEPWDWIESMKVEDLCTDEMPDKLPNVFHYCQFYQFNQFELYKAELKNKMHLCSHPLLEEPTADLVRDFDFKGVANFLFTRSKEKQIQWAERVNKREAFSVCKGIQIINEAMEHHRLHACGDDGNTEKSFRIHSKLPSMFF